MQHMQCGTVYLPVNDTFQLWQAGDVSALTVVTSLRNADVTWREVRTPPFPAVKAAERRIAWFASFLSNSSVTQPRRPRDRRFINFTWPEHPLTAGCERQGEMLGGGRAAAAALHSSLEMSKLSAEKVIVVVCCQISPLYKLCARWLSFRYSDGAEHASGPLSLDWDELHASCGLKVIVYLLLKSFSYVLR